MLASVPAVREDFRLQCLDALRGIAAAIVLVQHVVVMFPRPEGAWYSSLFFRIASMSGVAAVDLFFVLSGFVLTLPYVGNRAKPMDYADFTVRRLTRLYPAYWLSVVVALLARLTLSDQVHQSGLSTWATAYWTTPLTGTEVARTLSMVVPFDSSALNTAFWSLIVEMQMSLLLPFFIVALAMSAAARSSLLVLAIVIVVSLTVASGSALQFLPLFVLGALLARYREEVLRRLQAQSGAASWVLLLVSLALLEARLYTWRFPALPSQYLPGIGAGLLIVLVLARWRHSRFLENAATGLLGTASYSLYLLHIPVILLIVPPLYARTGSVAVCLAACLAVSVALAQIVFTCLEMPCQQAGRRLGRIVSKLIQRS